MTGKEALKEIRLVRVYIDEFGCAVPLKKVKEYKIIENELDELTKYKRAFEILKRTGLRIVEYDADEYSQYLMFTKGIDTDVEPEEAELLEELMNNENI